MSKTAAELPINIKDDPELLFTLLESIGKGSYGDVYKALINGTQSICAIKIIPLEPHEDLSGVLAEVEMLKSCLHSNVVSYVGCYYKRGVMKGKDFVWIAMEYCGGGSIESCYKSNLI